MRLSQLAGMVYYNQEAATSHIYANLVALLPRQDPLEAALTVAQNLQLAADLALPPHFTRHRKACLIEEVLDLLALRPLQHCLVASPPHAGRLRLQQTKCVIWCLITAPWPGPLPCWLNSWLCEDAVGLLPLCGIAWSTHELLGARSVGALILKSLHFFL